MNFYSVITLELYNVASTYVHPIYKGVTLLTAHSICNDIPAVQDLWDSGNAVLTVTEIWA